MCVVTTPIGIAHPLVLASLAISLSCGSEIEGNESPSPTHTRSVLESESAGPSRVESPSIDELSALGYVDGTEPARPSKGVTKHDPLRVAPGLNLITSGHAPVALLMNLQGEVVHEWRAEFSEVFPDRPPLESTSKRPRNYWRDALLLPNGELLVIWELFGLFKLDRDSRVLWSVAAPVHHDLQLDASGQIVHLEAERRQIDGIPGAPAIEDFIVVRDPSGKELRRVAMSDALRGADWPSLRRHFWNRSSARGYPFQERSRSDPFHTNSIWLLTSTEADRLGPPFRAGDALVSMAMLDTIAAVDIESGTARWWQQGPFGMQHEPRPTPDGAIVVFNNFEAANRSSVLVLDPRTRSVLRTYRGPAADPLHSRRSGRVQVLPNGNVLVVETDRGRALEVTKNDRVVWEYHSPYRVGTERDHVANLYGLERVGSARLGWLELDR
jgi:hypothetical protein